MTFTKNIQTNRSLDRNAVLAVRRRVNIMVIVQTESQATSMPTATDIRLDLN